VESDARVAGPKRLPVTTGPDAGEGQTARNVTVPMSFEERRKELEALICEFHHTLWERGLPVPSEAGRAALDQEAFVRDLARKLEGGLAMLPPRRSARTLAGHDPGRRGSAPRRRLARRSPVCERAQQSGYLLEAVRGRTSRARNDPPPPGPGAPRACDRTRSLEPRVSSTGGVSRRAAGGPRERVRRAGAAYADGGVTTVPGVRAARAKPKAGDRGI
jgi:hypothetical protein